VNERVTVAIDRGVADVRLNRPDKLNALDTDMFVGLVDAGARLATEPSVRAVVLSGEGRSFSAGLDFSGFTAMADGGRATGDGDGEPTGGDGLRTIGATEGRITHLAQQAAHCWSEVPVPVIAAISGHCLGGGLQIALGADIRIVHPDASRLRRSVAMLDELWRRSGGTSSRRHHCGCCPSASIACGGEVTAISSSSRSTSP